MTRRKKFELHLALVPVVAADTTALSSKLAQGKRETMMKKTILSVMMLLAAGVAGAQVENTWTVRPMVGLT